jgi:hypothetical protein
MLMLMREEMARTRYAALLEQACRNRQQRIALAGAPRRRLPFLRARSTD